MQKELDSSSFKINQFQKYSSIITEALFTIVEDNIMGLAWDGVTVLSVQGPSKQALQVLSSRDWCKKKQTGLDLAMKMDAFSIF